MGSAGWKWVRRIRNSECGIARGRSEKVFINTKKAPVGGRFLLMLFLHRDVRLSRKFVAVAAELLHKHAGIVCSRHQPNRAKGSPEGRRPLGFFHKHAEVVCKCAQFNRAKGSREQLPCGVKGQRPLGHSCHTSPSDRSQPTTSICHADSSAAGVRMAEISP